MEETKQCFIIGVTYHIVSYFFRRNICEIAFNPKIFATRRRARNRAEQSYRAPIPIQIQITLQPLDYRSIYQSIYRSMFETHIVETVVAAVAVMLVHTHTLVLVLASPAVAVACH